MKIKMDGKPTRKFISLKRVIQGSLSIKKDIKMDRAFLRATEKLGEEARAELSHGNGLDTEETAKDFLDHFQEKLVRCAMEFAKIKVAMVKKYPNIK